MKLNWGFGITIAIIGFMGFILFMVFQATNTKHDLQAEDYYAQEIKYQDKIDALQNGNLFRQDIDLLVDENTLEFELPEDLKADDGIIIAEFLRPNDASLDKSFTIPQDSPHLLTDELLDGFYQITLIWKQDGKMHAVETEITLTR